MRFRWLTLAMGLGVTLCTAAAHAVGITAYQTARANIPNLLVAPDIDQLLAKPGCMTELQGVVNGLFTNDDTYGYLLRIDATHTLVLGTKTNDPDIIIGKPLRVLARVPEQGTMLESLQAMPVTNLTPAPPAGAPAPATRSTAVAPARPVTVSVDPRDTADAPVSPPALSTVVRLYAERMRMMNRGLDDALANTIAYHLLTCADTYGVDPRLVFALVAQESRFNPRAVSRAGARGLGQLMPATAASLGVSDSFDIAQNLDGSVRYLRAQLDSFGESPLALAAYNAGPGSVRKYGGIPPYRETQHYSAVVWQNYCMLAGRDPNSAQQIATR